MEVNDVYDKLNFGASFSSNDNYPGNEVLQRLVISTYACPSTSLPRTYDSTAGRGMIADYIGISGAVPKTGNTRGVYKDCSYGYSCDHGVMLQNEVVSLRQVTDGTAKTMVVAEQSGPIAGADLRSAHHGGWLGARTQHMAKNCTSDHWETGITCIRYHINTQNSGLSGANYRWANNGILVSEHDGGVNALMLDASVTFLSESMDFAILRRLATKDDGESFNL